MLKDIKSIYIIGIGGISMSALALLLQHEGMLIKGADLHLSPLTSKLLQQGIEIVEGNAPQFVLQCDAICYTGAVGDDNPDIYYGKMLGKKIFTRAEILGYFSMKKKTISVAGTHGKTTTTGMISSILLESGLDPTIHIGGELKNINSNLHIGKGDYFVTEACEYKDAFLSLKNDICVVLNIEEDHLDYFKSFDNIQRSFNQFIANTDENGLIVYNFDACEDKIDRDTLKKYKTISFGFNKGADLRAENLKEKRGCYSFDLLFREINLGTFCLNCLGKHNIYNALASIGVCLNLGLSVEEISRGLKEFKGIGRRMEIVRNNSPFIIHDYAHHPQEIEASLNAIKNVSNEKLICVFQPHTYTRTKAFWKEFLNCFSLCDEVWFLPIYPAREKQIEGVSSNILCDEFQKSGGKSRLFQDFESCQKEIEKYKYKNITFAILGAGDIEILANNLKK